MKLVVLKFGGTSVADEQSRRNAMRHVAREREMGNQVIVVISAMGRKGSPYATDTLISLLQPNPSPQYYDLLLSCGEVISACVFADALKNVHGIEAIAMTGASAGIRTTDCYGSADVIGVDVLRIHAELLAGKVPVITGFQGINSKNEITTLGRGGSDTSAAEIGGHMDADRVDIYTDVPGIATADPRIVKDARYMDRVNSDDIMELANWGASVIHPRAVAAAKKFQRTMYVRSTFDDNAGTVIYHGPSQEKGFVGAAVVRNYAFCSDGPLALSTGRMAKTEQGAYSILTLIHHGLNDQGLEEISKSLSAVAWGRSESGGAHFAVKSDCANEALILICAKLDA